VGSKNDLEGKAAVRKQGGGGGEKNLRKRFLEKEEGSEASESAAGTGGGCQRKFLNEALSPGGGLRPWSLIGKGEERIIMDSSSEK